MKQVSAFFICACLMLLVGCAGSHDPREGGFFGGVAGLGGGSYKDRVAEREARLEELRSTQRQLDVETTQLEQQKSATQARIQQDRALVKNLQNEISSLDKQAKSLASTQGTNQKRVTELQERIKKLKSQTTQVESSLDDLEGSGLCDTDMDLRRKQLETQRNALRKEYDLLMKMQMELAQ